MRSAVPAIGLLVVMTAGVAAAEAHPGPSAETTPGPPVTSSIVVAPFFGHLLDELVATSATVRGQYGRLLSAPRVLVWVEPLNGPRAGTSARATIRRTASGWVLAKVELATPLRFVEYAEMLAHELEHVLEQVEGVSLSALAGEPGSAASRLHDGSYETERARGAGRAAAEEIEQNANAPHP